MSTTTLPRIQDLPDDERRAAYEDAAERVAEAGRQESAAHKSRKIDPRGAQDYRTYHTMDLVCVQVVQHRRGPASIGVSRDGSSYPYVYLPDSRTIILPESTGEFILALIPRPLVEWLERKEWIAGQRMRELFGITLPLSPARPWTKEQCATWEELTRIRMQINTKIQTANKRPTMNLSRRDVA
jgi:hypothetical protein